jgi:mannose-6-phosphate isomerase
MGLDELIMLLGKDLIGNKISQENFPLLIKFLDAQSKLSIQVHPDDEYAYKNGYDSGKTEIWVVLEAKENANMILGVSGNEPENFYNAIKNGNLEQYLKPIQVKKGDVYFIPSGLIHSMEGVLVAEIQQNSDTTYRVYDYNRGRELHIKNAIDVIDFSLSTKKVTGLCVNKEEYERIYYCYNQYFALEKYKIKESYTEISDTDRFYTYICIDGKGEILYRKGIEKINKGDTIFIPATLGEYTLQGPFELLKTYVPDIEKLEKEILSHVKC